MNHQKTNLKALALTAMLSMALPLTATQALAGSLPPAAVQQATTEIKGTVVDETGEPLIGVTVAPEGNPGAGVITDIDGNFSIKIPAKKNLVISYIGYATQTVSTAGKSVLNIQLQPENTTLKEVVVTAMGIRRKEESLTYATQQVRSSDLNRVQDPNVANSLEGKVSGITITPSAGGAGGASKIILRGNKSILGSSSPLIVIDGVPMTNSQHGQITSGQNMLSVSSSEGSDALSMINPDDIESINVLKGANAAALYGSVAANGVLMITTKKGREGKIGVTVSSNVTFDNPLTKPDLQTTYGAKVGDGTFGLYSWGNKVADGSEYIHDLTTTDADGNPVVTGRGVSVELPDYYYRDAQDKRQRYSSSYDVHIRDHGEDNLDDFYKTGVTTNNSIALSGGTDKMSSYFSYGNSRSTGMLPTNNYTRNTLSFRQMFKFFDRATINVSMSYITTKTKNRPGGGLDMNPIFNMYTAAPNIDMGYYKANYVIPDGQWISNERQHFVRAAGRGTNYQLRSDSYLLSGPKQNWAYWQGNQNNPYWLLYQNRSTQWEDRFFGNITGTLDLLWGFSIQARLGIDFDKYEGETDRYATTWLPSSMEDYGRYFWNYSKTTEFYTDYMLNFNNKFGDFDVSAAAGFVGHTIKGKNKGHDGSPASYIDPQYQFVSDLVNWWSVSSGGAGATTQSRSSDWNRGLVFTASAGWRDAVYLDFSYRQDWYRSFKQFKAKGTPDNYGYFGVGANAIVSNLVKMPEWWNYLKYRVSYSEVGNSIPNQVYGARTYNWRRKTYTLNMWADFDNPRPEKTHSFETGFEALFLKNCLSFDFTYYNASVSNLYLVGTNTSGKSVPMNSAKIRNQGIEATIGYDFKPMKDMHWKTSFNFSYNKNDILKSAYQTVDNEDGTQTTREMVIANYVGPVQVLYQEGGSVGDMYVTPLRTYKVQEGQSLDANGYILNADGTNVTDAKGNNVKPGWYFLDSQGHLVNSSDTEDRYSKFIGNMNANWQLGWTNTFTWKDFTLSFLINGRIGGKVLSITERYLDTYGVSGRSGAARLAAEANGVYATQYGDNVLGMQLGDGSGRIIPIESYYGSTDNIERYIYSGTNFRLRELSLGYTFRDLFGQNRNLSLSFIARNLFFFYKDAPVDPDVSLSTGNGLSAFEMFNYPSSRSFGFSLNMNF